MRFPVFVLGALFLGQVAVTAQVSVEVILAQDQFLRDESLPVKVRVTNRSGQPLALGAEPNWIVFTIENRDGHAVKKFEDVPVPGEFKLQSSMLADRVVDVMPYFDLGVPGRYRLTATIRIRAWNEEVSSRARDFDIIRGAKLWEQEFGVPTRPGEPPEVRKYTLQQARYLKNLRLYLRVTDVSEHRVFRVTPVANLISFSRPEPQFDRESNLHVLTQTGARTFNYTVLTPDGNVISRETHRYTSTRPALGTDKQGNIRVVNGERQYAKDDLPPVSLASLAAEAALTNQPMAAATNNAAATNAAPAKSKGKKEKKK